MKRIKFEGCQCEYKEKEWEVDLTNETYDESKDLFACCQCADLNKYKAFNKKKLKGAKDLQQKGHTTDYFIIYGAKSKEIEEGQYKCLDCSTIDYVPENSFCESCGSKNIEAKYNGIHFTIEECKECKKVADVKYHNLSDKASEEQKKLAKQNWKEAGNLCSCKKQNTQKPNSWKKPLLITGGIILGVAIIGVIVYYLTRTPKTEELYE